jgi:hypothetical protein
MKDKFLKTLRHEAIRKYGSIEYGFIRNSTMFAIPQDIATGSHSPSNMAGLFGG